MVGMLLFKGGKVWGGFGWVMGGSFYIFVHKLLISKGNNGKSAWHFSGAVHGNRGKNVIIGKFLASQTWPSLKVQKNVLCQTISMFMESWNPGMILGGK